MFSLIKAFKSFKPSCLACKFSFPITRTENLNLEIKCFTHVMEKSLPKNPPSILHQFNEFDNTLSQVGDDWVLSTNSETGEILLKLFKQRNPKKVLELGSYMGYSAVLFASHATQPDFKFVSLEISPLFWSMANSLIKRAGLENHAESRFGGLEQHIDDLKKEFDAFDLIFFDHDVDLFVPHLKLLEKYGLITDETIFLADNVKCPGAPEYLEFVQKHYDTTLIDIIVKPNYPDLLTVSKRKKK